MELQYLKEFVVLAETTNFLKAADQLFIAQSALSRHIMLMEKTLGVNLFTRTTRSTKLTEHGAIFLPYARAILDLQDEYTQALREHLIDGEEKLSIGCFPVPAPYGITDFITKFAEEHKTVTVTMTADDDSHQLHDGTADLIFMRDIGPRDPDMKYRPFYADVMVAILPEDSPYAQRETITLEELRDERFLFLQKNSRMYDLCLNSCRAAGFEPKVAYSGSHADNILSLARVRTGVGLLTKRPIQYLDTRGLCIIEIAPAITTPICLVYPKKLRHYAAIDLFLAAFEACFDGLTIPEEQ